MTPLGVPHLEKGLQRAHCLLVGFHTVAILQRRQAGAVERHKLGPTLGETRCERGGVPAGIGVARCEDCLLNLGIRRRQKISELRPC